MGEDLKSALEFYARFIRKNGFWGDVVILYLFSKKYGFNYEILQRDCRLRETRECCKKEPDFILADHYCFDPKRPTLFFLMSNGNHFDALLFHSKQQSVCEKISHWFLHYWQGA